MHDHPATLLSSMVRSIENTNALHTAPRLFVSVALNEGAGINASAEQAHYLGPVLRRASGDIVRLFNGSDGEWSARLTFARPDKKSRGAVLTVEERLRPQQIEAGHWLVFALLKRDATDLVVRQAVELGASRLLPVVTERTNAGRVNHERLRAIATEAAEQSERLTVPSIDNPARLDAVLAAWPVERRLFAALERTSHDAMRGLAEEKRALLIGPEGGFSPHEATSLYRFPFVTPISLGPFVLRAETAAASGQALLLAMGWAEYAKAT
jgi:16S rRNA (uracil1498-N3)-methyltransferase